MKVGDLRGTPGTDIVLQGSRLDEFIRLVESLPAERTAGLDFVKLRGATRITGTDNVPEPSLRRHILGDFFGHTWITDF